VVFGFLFVFLVSFALPVLNIAGDLLDGEAYKASLREQDIYARFPDLFAEQMQLSQPSLAKEAHRLQRRHSRRLEIDRHTAGHSPMDAVAGRKPDRPDL
jgi:hypothetical protein